LTVHQVIDAKSEIPMLQPLQRLDQQARARAHEQDQR
jgi:hypothetical protein